MCLVACGKSSQGGLDFVLVFQLFPTKAKRLHKAKDHVEVVSPQFSPPCTVLASF